MRLQYTPEAIWQLRQIRDYISGELHNPSAGKRVKDSIVADCRRLKEYPNLGISINLVDDGRPVRLLVSGNYVVVYEIQGDNINIVSVEDTRTNWISMLMLV